MIQYPNEKDPQSDWVYPGQQQASYAAPPSYPPPTQNPPYPHAGQGGTSYGPPSQYDAPPPPQGYIPSQGPPPDYAYAQGQPDGRSAYDQKNPSYAAAPYPAPDSQPYYNAPAPNATGPSSSSSSEASQEGKQGMSLATFFGNKGPPPMWQRPPPAQLPYNAFPPMSLISTNHDLSAGFPEVPPPCQLSPHPFATHDVTEEDWKRFLADVKKAGGLSPGENIKSNVLPMVMGMGIMSGIFMTRAIGKKMKYKHRGAAGDVVDHWNHYFFGPRRMEVELHQASERLSGKLGDSMHRSADSSSDSSSEDERRRDRGDRHADRHARKAARRERRATKKAMRAERRDWKARGDDKTPYLLVVTATN